MSVTSAPQTSSISSDPRDARMRALLDALTTQHLDAIVITSRPNVRYLTGFTGSNGMVLITATDRVLFTDPRYDEQVRHEVGDFAQIRIDSASLWSALWDTLHDMPRIGVLGFESTHVVHRDFERFLSDSEGARWQWRPTLGIVEELRAVKDASEIALIQEAANIATQAYAATLPQIHAGLTELDAVGILELELRRAGSEGVPFESIVAAGPRSALPHARPGRRVIEDGDFLLFDFGATVGGYCSDITRTVVIGRASDEQRAIYNIVREANEHATASVAAGMTGIAADALARDYITAAGFGDCFGHSLGHGIGLEIHEAPRLSRTADAVLPVDAVITIEPGIYRPGWGGVRIEDDIVLGEEGIRILTDFTHDLLELTA